MTRTTRRQGFLFAAALSALAMISCSDFFGNEDLRESIREEVDIANAPQVTLTVTADPASGGSLSVLGVASKKVGENFSLTAIPFGGYTFAGWTAAGSGDVVFTDPSLPTTTARVGTEAADIVITAHFAPRPNIWPNGDYSPTGTGVLLNQAIYAQFSREMDPASFSDATISVTSKPVDVPGAVPFSIRDKFTLTSSTLGFFLTPAENMDSYARITVTVSKNVRAADGTTMAEDFSWYFTTGTVADASVPTFEGGITVDRGQGATEAALQMPGGAYAVAAAPITINLTGKSNSATATVTAIEITETDSGSGGSVTNLYGYQSPRPYTLQISGEGEKILTLRLRNSNGNVSAPAAVSVFLDQTPPLLDSILLAGGAAYTGSLSPSLAIGSHSDDATGIGGYALAASPAVPASWSGTAPASAAITAGDGPKTVYLHVRDRAGNSVYAFDSINLDTAPPSVSVGTITTTGNPGWVRNGQSVTVPFTVTESGSGLSGTAPAVTIAGQPAALSGSFPDYEASLEFSGAAITQGEVSCTITASDLAGNAMTPVSASTGITYDREAPGVSIGAPGLSTANNGTDVSYTVTYGADAVVSLAAAQVQLSAGGTAAGVVKSVTGTGTTRTVTLTAGAGNGTLAFSLPVGTASDPAGNSSDAAGPSASFTVDNRPPEVLISGPSTNLVNGTGSVSYTVTYDETGVYALTPDLVTLNATGDAAGTVSVSGGATSSATVTISSPAGNGTLGITIKTAAMTDSAGNPSAASAASALFTVDTTPPAITGESLSADAGTITGFTSADDGGSGLDADGYSLAGGTGDFDGSEMSGLGTMTKGSSKDYTITATDLAGNEKTVTVRRSRDAAGDYTAEIVAPPAGAFLPRFSAAARSLSAASPAPAPRSISVPSMPLSFFGFAGPDRKAPGRENPLPAPAALSHPARPALPPAEPPVPSAAPRALRAKPAPAAAAAAEAAAEKPSGIPETAAAPENAASTSAASTSAGSEAATVPAAEKAASAAAAQAERNMFPAPAVQVPAREAPGNSGGGVPAEKPAAPIEAVLPSGRKSPEDAAQENEAVA